MKRLVDLLKEGNVTAELATDCVCITDLETGLSFQVSLSQAKRLCSQLQEIIQETDAMNKDEEMFDITPLDFEKPKETYIPSTVGPETLSGYRFRG